MSFPLHGNATLYEKDKVFAVQHLVANEGSKILFDRDLEYGPPDKAQHFCDDFSLLPKRKPVHKSHERAKNE